MFSFLHNPKFTIDSPIVPGNSIKEHPLFLTKIYGCVSKGVWGMQMDIIYYVYKYIYKYIQELGQYT